MIPQNPITYYGDAPSPIEAGQRYASHPNELVAPAIIRGFELTSQVTEGTMSAVDGSADVGLVIDGVIFAATTPANNAALVAALSALPMAQALGIAFTNPAGSTLRVAFSDYASHTIASYSPGGPDITGITSPTAASDPQFVPYGCALITDAAAGDIVAAVLPASEYAPDDGFTFAGLLARVNGDRHSDDQKRLLGFVSGVTEGLAPSLHADCVEIGLFKCALGTGGGAAVRGKPAYFETANGANCGKFYPASNGASQVTRGDVTFNGTDAVGLVVDALPTLSVASNTSDDQTATDLRDKWNASAQHAAVATASIDLSGAESYIILTFLDQATHTVAPYSPATADVTGITNTTAAAAGTRVLAPGCRWGRAHRSGAEVGYLEIGVHP
jgi:hypothetical protein